jgi:hypothetical protein
MKIFLSRFSVDKVGQGKIGQKEDNRSDYASWLKR